MNDPVARLKALFPEYPLPDAESYRVCIRLFAYRVYESPIVEFCEYVHARRLSWFECSWEADILPLEEDTTILPYHVLITPFLRYYMPTCLHVAIRYFQGEYARKDVGNVKLFVERTLFIMAAFEMLLSDEERQFMADVDVLFVDNELYKEARKVAAAFRAWKCEG